jgi:hypothetical protein
VQSVLTTIGAVVALVTASVGVIAAIQQLTLRARLRRTAELAQALSGHEDDPERQTVLRSIQDVAIARLVSGWLLPWWRFSEFTVSLVTGPVLVVWTMAVTGWNEVSLSLALAAFALLTITTRRAVRLYLERQRVAREYLSGAKMTPPRIGFSQMAEGRIGAEYAVGASFSAGVILTAAGIGTLVYGGPHAGWGLLFLAIGPQIGGVSSSWLRVRTVRPLATNSAHEKQATGAS